jgi:hypothetical protein
MAHKPDDKWYFKPSIFIIALLFVGPFALPLIWFNPGYSRKAKIIISIIVHVVSYYLSLLLYGSLRSISRYYRAVFQGTLDI